VPIAVAFVLVGPPSAPEAQQREVTAARGVVQSTVSGSGNLEPAEQLDLSFGTSGTVTAVYVEAGEKVVEGQTLARLDPRSARVQLAQAKAEYQAAEDALASVGSTADAVTTTTAVATSVGTSGSPSAVATASQTETAPEEAPADTDDADVPAAGDAPRDDGDSGSTPDPEPSDQEPADQQQSGAPSSSDVAPTGATGGDDAPASSGISQAEAEANLESARLALEEAEQALANTVLRAPASGTVAEVNGAVGDTTSGGSTQAESSSESSESTAGATPTVGGGGASSSSTSSGSSGSGSGFVTLVQLDQLNLEVAFSESDIGKLKVGQAATVAVNALPDVELAARVTSIGTLPDSSGDVVEYPVTLTLKQMDRRLKPGMTASGDVVVSQVEGAVSLPSQAISQGPGGATVIVSEGGEQERRSVTTGLEGDTATEIVSGLRPGDRVVIVSSAAATTASGSLPAAGRGGLGGGGLPSGGALPSGGFPAGGVPGGGGGFPGGGPR
jgi:HlyD family secretion protein